MKVIPLCGIAMLVLLSGGCNRALPTQGATSERALIRAYVTALEQRDLHSMQQLLHPASDPASAAAEIAAAGGVQFEHVAVELKYSESLTSSLSTAELSLTSRDSRGAIVELRRTLPLVKDRDRWFLSTGLPQALPSSP